MSANNGVIRIGRKGIVKFAFGDDGEPFEVDVIVSQQEWFTIDETFRIEEGLAHEGEVPPERMADYHRAAVEFVYRLSVADKMIRGVDVGPPTITTAEALDFLARLREQYSGLVVFFQPKLPEKPDLHDSSEAELRFSAEAP